MNLLLLSTTTGYQARSFAEAARRLDLRVVFGTDRCHVLDDPWQDAALPLRFEDPAQSARVITDFAERQPIHGVVAVGDQPTVTAALACRALGLPWHSPEAAETCRDKFLARRASARKGLRAPAYNCGLVADGVEALLPFARFPCVLKPLGLSASRGVIRADTPEQFRAAFTRIAALNSGPRIMVEEFVPGREFAVEALLDRSRLKVLAVFDKPDPLDGPYFEETIYVTPARIGADEQAAISESLRQAVAAFGLYHGPLHAEFRVNEHGPWLIEVAARPIGGLCARALRFGPGISLEELVVRNSLGESLDAFERETGAAGVMMIPVPEAGVFQGVEGVDEAMRIEGVEEIHITAKLGQNLLPWPDGASYPGFIFARAPAPAAVEAALRRAHAALRFSVSPALPTLKASSVSTAARTLGGQ